MEGLELAVGEALEAIDHQGFPDRRGGTVSGEVEQGMAAEASPVKAMKLTDSGRGDISRPLFLTFDGEVAPGEPFAHLVPNKAMQAALLAAVEGRVEILTPVEITGLAWSGRGRIERVEISTDNGQTWQNAEIQEPRYTKAFTRFRLPWRWDGAETILQSRCTDDTGYVQPANEALIAARGMNSDYHNNAIKSWKIGPDGSVENVNA